MEHVVLITGATSGFGNACAKLFAENGWKVVATGRRKERLDRLTEQYGEQKMLGLSFDVRNSGLVEQALISLPESFQKIDVLVNSAGLALGQDLAHEAFIEDWDTMIDTNIKGLIYMTRRILPIMVARNKGHIVNISSVGGNYPYPGGNVYGASKAFVSMFTNNLIADLRDTNVRVTNIEPGLAKTEFANVRFKGDQKKAETALKGTEPLTAKDIADAVYWAVSRPDHVNINRIEIMPVCQSFNHYYIARKAEYDLEKVRMGSTPDY